MSVLTATLWISLISIVLLFAAMAVIWGMMALFARSPGRSNETATETIAAIEIVSPEADAPEQPRTTEKEKAAGLAVSIALALRTRSQRLAMKDLDNSVSAWQSVRSATRASQRSQLFVRK